MTKKTLISNTVLFIGIIGYILLFGALFGQGNILIGVSTVTAMLMLLERDLTIHPIANTLKFAALNVFMGAAAFFAGFNVWLGIPIHFITMFVIGYTLIFNLRNPLYLPFSLQYLFLLAIPATSDEMPVRLIGLVFGAISIMAMQLAANRKRISKHGEPLIQETCKALIVKIDRLLEGKDSKEEDLTIRTSINSLRTMIYDQREANYYLTDEGSLNLNISAALEKIHSLVDKMEKEGEDAAVISRVKEFLGIAAEGVADPDTAEDLQKSAEELLNEHRQSPSLFTARILANTEFLAENLLQLAQHSGKKSSITSKIEGIPQKFRRLGFFKGPNHSTSLKFSYAIRIAFGIAFSGFLTDYFNLEEGRWIMFTVLSLIVPFYEQSHQKMRDRIFATIAGAILVWLLFAVFRSEPARTALLLFAGYLMSYVKIYRYSTILVTFSAIGSVALITGETQFLTVERLFMVVIGVVIALFINRFIIPYREMDARQDLKWMYNDTIKEMVSELAEDPYGKKHGHSMKNLLIITTMIEERLKQNMQNKGESEVEMQWLTHQRLAACTLYELSIWIKNHGQDIKENCIVDDALVKLKACQSETDGCQSYLSELEHQMKQNSIWEQQMIISIIYEAASELQDAQNAFQQRKLQPGI
ncbi:FUSC family protein [Cytobacillus sp. FSL H8-0458]|uniref:FUSC family protein n=1 Tax=Cytobacillus sp. FSL H8-0458 TaxID=2975346 RepID=UPI0030F85391